MRKKGTSQGSVYYDKRRKRWITQIFEVDPVTQESKKKSKSFNTEEDARNYIRTRNYQRENVAYIENNGIPLIEIMKTNVRLKLESNQIREAQYERVMRTIKTLEESKVVHKNIDDITTEELQAYVNTLTRYSDSTIKKLYQQFTSAFKTAVNKGYIIRNPMTSVLRPRSAKPTKLIRAMTIDEEIKFIRYLQTQTIESCSYKNVFFIQLFMGLRIGECLALCISDIDLKHRLLYVHKTLTQDINGNVILSNSPKTKAGNRYLPITEQVYPFIVEQMKYCETLEHNEDKLLFKAPINKYVDRENVNRAMQKILKQLDIPQFSSHTLRHTYATRSIEAGVTPVVLQKLMGHTDVSITLNTYTFVLDKYKETEIEKVNKYYMEQNLLNPSNEKQVYLENGTTLIDGKSTNEN